MTASSYRYVTRIFSTNAEVDTFLAQYNDFELVGYSAFALKTKGKDEDKVSIAITIKYNINKQHD